MRPGAVVVNKSVFLGVIVDVSDKRSKVGIVSDGFSFEVFFKQAAGAVIGLIDGFRVGSKESRNLLTYSIGTPFLGGTEFLMVNRLQGTAFLIFKITYPHQKVEMIP